MIRCIAVDDEPFALKLIEEYCQKIPSLQLLASCHQASKLKELMEKQTVELVFMDINMPDISGMDLSRQLPSETKIIFTTAYAQYALESYQVNALDYLLKPFSFQEFSRSIQKAEDYFKLLRSGSSQAEEYIFVKSDYQLRKIALIDILFIENIKDYVRFFLKSGEKIMSLMSLKSLEEQLPIDQFLKIHRSYIVAKEHINSYNKSSVQIGTHKLPVSHGNKHKLKNINS